MGPRSFSRRLLFLSPCLAIALTFLAALAARAQDTTEPLDSFREEVSVEVVNVDVWVSDRKGQPVTGLTREDFQLFEDGKPVEISNFAAFEAAGHPPPAGSSQPAPEVAAGAAGTADKPGGASAPEPERRLVVFVDDWNLRPEDRIRVLDDLRTFVRDQAGPGVFVMVVLHDGAVRVVLPFTHDPVAVSRTFDAIEKRAPSGLQARSDRRTALEAIRDAYSRAIEAGRPGGPGVTPVAAFGGTDPCSAYWGEMENAAHNYSVTTAGQVEQSLGALVTVTDFLAGLPGQKVLLYVGDGMEGQPGEDLYHYLAQLCPARQSEVALAASSYDLTGGFRQLTSRANAHGVTFYTLEAEGPGGEFDLSIQGGTTFAPSHQEESLDSQGSGGSSGGLEPSNDRFQSFGTVPEAPETGGSTLRPSAAVERLRASNLEGPLFTMAHETGGRAVLNAIDFAPELERLGEELGTYYSLGFVPGHLGDDHTHALEVKVAGKGYTVRHRASYRDKPLEMRYVERIFAAARMGVEQNPLGVRLELGDSVAVGSTGRLAVPLRIWVPLDRLTLVAGEDEKATGRLRVMLSASDGEGGMTPVRQKLVPVEVGAGERDRGEEGQGAEKLVEVQLDLPPGRHLVALGVRDEVGGEVSYLRYPFELDASGAVPRSTDEAER